MLELNLVKTSLNFKSNGKMGGIDLYNKWKIISLLLLNNKESLKKNNNNEKVNWSTLVKNYNL
jgi:hypothetical protein